jgi:hypothetical protein
MVAANGDGSNVNRHNGKPHPLSRPNATGV